MAVLRQKTCAPPAGRPKLLSLPPSRAFLLCQAIFRRQTSVVRAPDLCWLSVLFPSPFRADQSVPSIPYNFSPFFVFIIFFFFHSCGHDVFATDSSYTLPVRLSPVLSRTRPKSKKTNKKVGNAANLKCTYYFFNEINTVDMGRVDYG